MVKNIFKLCALSASLMMVSMAAHANFEWNDPCDQYTGPYVGAQFGYNGAVNDQKSSFVNNPGTVPLVGDSSANISIDGVEGGLLLGYGHRLPHHFYVGGEVYGNLSSASGSISMNPSALVFNTSTSTISTQPLASSKVTEKMTGDWGFNFDPGVFLTPNTLLFGVVGPTFAEVRSTSSSFAQAGFFGYSGNFNKTLSGLKVGAGMSAAIARNVNLRMEYDHDFYPTFNKTSATFPVGAIPGGTPAQLLAAGFIAKTKFDFSNNELLGSIVYHL